MLTLDGYKNKSVVVSGCYSGIGRAVSEFLIELGASVHGLDIKAPDLPLASFSTLDLSDPVSIDATAIKLNFPIDALFNCAGLAPTKDPRAVVKVNIIGLRYLTEQLVPLMPAGAGIVSIGSNGGAGWRKKIPLHEEFLATRTYSEAVSWWDSHSSDLNAYNFSKEAIVVWTMQQSSVLIKRGIRVNCTSPGAVQTPMLDEIESAFSSTAVDTVAQPIGRRSTAREQAIPLVMLNSELFSYVNGIDMPVDGGFIASRLFAK